MHLTTIVYYSDFQSKTFPWLRKSSFCDSGPNLSYRVTSNILRNQIEENPEAAAPVAEKVSEAVCFLS